MPAAGTTTNTHHQRRSQALKPFCLRLVRGACCAPFPVPRGRGVDRQGVFDCSHGPDGSPVDDLHKRVWSSRDTECGSGGGCLHGPGDERLGQVVPLALGADLDDVAPGAGPVRRHRQADVERPDAAVVLLQAVPVDVGEEPELGLRRRRGSPAASARRRSSPPGAARGGRRRCRRARAAPSASARAGRAWPGCSRPSRGVPACPAAAGSPVPPSFGHGTPGGRHGRPVPAAGPLRPGDRPPLAPSPGRRDRPRRTAADRPARGP